MFSLDTHVGPAELRGLEDIWQHLDAPARANAADVFNGGHSGELHAGISAAFVSAARLTTGAWPG